MAVQLAHAPRRSIEVPSALLGAWDQLVPRAQACTPWLPAAHPPVLCQLWNESLANGQALATTGSQALVFFSVTRDMQSSP